MNNKIILDTHILIWSILAPDNLTAAVKEQIETAQDAESLYISAITLWEITMLISKKQINVFERTSDFLNSITNIDGLNVIPIDADIASESVMLPGDFIGDPADCLIIASTRKMAGNLVTRDQKIISWANQGYLRHRQVIYT